MQTEMLSLRISAAEGRALRERASREGVSQASLVRRALRAQGITPPETADAAGPSGFDLVQHLIGSVESDIGDLSSNPRHLRGYGR